MLPANVPERIVPNYTPEPLPTGIRLALRVLVSEFPRLLEKHFRKWVACDKTGVLFLGDSQETVYKRCLKTGLKPDEFVVDYLLPGGLDDLDMDSLRDPD